MTLTDTQLAEIRERVGRGESISERDHARLIADRFLDVPYADPDGDECVLSRQFNRAVEFIASLESQLSTIRKEATDAEREACAKIADVTKGAAVYAFWSGERACHSVAESIRARSNLPGSRAPTGDEGR